MSARFLKNKALVDKLWKNLSLTDKKKGLEEVNYIFFAQKPELTSYEAKVTTLLNLGLIISKNDKLYDVKKIK